MNLGSLDSLDIAEQPLPHKDKIWFLQNIL